MHDVTLGRHAQAAAVGGGGATGVTAAVLLAQASPEVLAQWGSGSPLAVIGTAALLAGVPGALAGLGWSAAQDSLRGRGARALPPSPPDPLGGGVWRDTFDACAEHAARFRDVVDSVAPGAARDWLVDIAADVDDELRDAYALAELGQRVAPTSGHFVPRDGPPLDIHRRLTAAEDRFAAAADNVGAVATRLARSPRSRPRQDPARGAARSRTNPAAGPPPRQLGHRLLAGRCGLPGTGLIKRAGGPARTGR